MKYNLSFLLSGFRSFTSPGSFLIEISETQEEEITGEPLTVYNKQWVYRTEKTFKATS